VRSGGSDDERHWDRTVSTVAFKGGLTGYYQEMGGQVSK